MAAASVRGESIPPSSGKSIPRKGLPGKSIARNRIVYSYDQAIRSLGMDWLAGYTLAATSA